MRFLVFLLNAADIFRGFNVSTSDPPICNFTAPTAPVIGSTYPLCVFMMSGPVGDPTSTNYVAQQIQSIAFGPSVDTYSMLNLVGSYAQFNPPLDDQNNLYAWMTGVNTLTAWPRECALDEGVPPTFQVDAGTVQSCPQLVTSVTNTIPVASLVAVMDNGVLINLIWDNQCQTCPVSSDLCMAGNLALTIAETTGQSEYLTANSQSKITDNRMCGVSQTQCNSTTNTTGINCDFRILLTWSGTDSKGKRLLSSNLRLTQFSGSSVGSMWNSIANSFNPPGETSSNTVSVR